MRRPRRIVLSRKKGARMPEGTVVCTRASKRWGNPFRVGEMLEVMGAHGYLVSVVVTQELAVALYRAWVEHQPDLIEAIRTDLAGRNLGCFCKLGDPCHCDVLLKIANPDLKHFGGVVFTPGPLMGGSTYLPPFPGQPPAAPGMAPMIAIDYRESRIRSHD